MAASKYEIWLLTKIKGLLLSCGASNIFLCQMKIKKKPNISPQAAKHKNKIAAFYFSKHRPYNCKRKYEQHYRHKSDESIN